MRTLFITQDMLSPQNSGARQRSALIHRALCEVSQVDVLVVDVYGHTWPEAVLAEMKVKFSMLATLTPSRPSETGWWRYLRKFNPSLVQRLAHNLNQFFKPYHKDAKMAERLAQITREHSYDLIVARYLKVAALSGCLDFNPVIVDVDDLDSEIFSSRLSLQGLPWWKRIILRCYANRFHKLEGAVLRKVSNVFVTKLADKQRLGLDNIRLLHNIPYVPSGGVRYTEVPIDGNIILMVGKLDWPRNSEAVDYFVDIVWPEIRRQVPDAIFRVVGKVAEPDRARWASVAGVEVVGYAESLEGAYRDAAFTVAPIRAGGGTNIKVLESLAYGRTCVALRHAMRGFEGHLQHEESLLIVEDGAAMAAACVVLLKDRKKAETMGERGRQVILEQYSYERFAETVKSTIEHALSPLSRHQQVVN